MEVSIDFPQLTSSASLNFYIGSISPLLWFYSSSDALAIVANYAGHPSDSYQVVSEYSTFLLYGVLTLICLTGLYCGCKLNFFRMGFATLHIVNMVHFYYFFYLYKVGTLQNLST